MRHRKKDRNEVRLTREGWIYLVVLGFIAVGAVLRNVNLLVLITGFMVAPLLLGWRIGRLRLRTLSAQRTLPNRVFAKRLAPIQWVVHNDSSVPALTLTIEDSIQKTDASASESVAEAPRLREGQEKSPRGLGNFFRSMFLKRSARGNGRVDFPEVGAHSSEAASYSAFFPSRGAYETGPATISTRFPFGLIVSCVRLPQKNTFYVAPEIGELHPVWEKRLQSMIVGADSLQRKRSLEDDEFFALRPWRSGDSKKHIHWRTTAKKDEPIVRQHDRPSNRDFAMLLDLTDRSTVETSVAPSEGATCSACERVLSFAATALLRLGQAVQGQVAVIIGGEETVVCRSRNHREILSQAMRAMAVARPIQEANLIEPLLELSRSVSRGTPLYIISTRPYGDEFQFLASDRHGASHARSAPGVPLAPFQLRNLLAIWPSVRWVGVDSEEFQELFSIDRESVQRPLVEMARKWGGEHAPC